MRLLFDNRNDLPPLPTSSESMTEVKGRKAKFRSGYRLKSFGF